MISQPCSEEPEGGWKAEAGDGGGDGGGKGGAGAAVPPLPPLLPLLQAHLMATDLPSAADEDGSSSGGGW